MSVQFGRWNFEGEPPTSKYIEKVAASIVPYGPDSEETYSKEGVRILYRAFHTTKESHHETQPYVSASGAVITWDGRLDNRGDLVSELFDPVTKNSTDVALVATAYEKWGTDCFAKFIGDWALSIWDGNNRSLVLAKDPIGIRHLYYSFDGDQVTWSSILDPLVRFADKTFVLDEEYVAGWLSMFPASHLTPYVGIDSVPPSSFVLLQRGKHGIERMISKYWDFEPGKKIRYSSDREYEEHFRAVFAKAVQRRLHSDRPVLAHLSGGMDSSSIVCMADTIIANGAAETPRLDTISWYNDSDPFNNERPYFTKVEEKRGRIGFHIDLASLRDREKHSIPDFESDQFAATPFRHIMHSEFSKQYAACLLLDGKRVVLSGLLGDEATGRKPTPVPELQNLLSRARFFTLARQLKAWASKMRKPPLLLLWEAVREFLPLTIFGIPDDARPAPWLYSDFARRNHANLCFRYPRRVELFGPLPSFQNQVATLDTERKMLAYFDFLPEPLSEMRYPYADRDFLEFMYRIPREQVVRVGQRRSLMRRSLVGIVPDEVLNRSRRVLVQQNPVKEQDVEKLTFAEWATLAETCQQMVGDSLGIVDRDRFLEALQKARRSEGAPLESLARTLTLEFWLRHLTRQGILKILESAKKQRHSSSLFKAHEFSARAQTNKFS